MSVLEILALIRAAAEVTATVADLVAKTRNVLSLEDRATLDAALAEMQLKSESDYAAARAALLAAAAES